MRKDRPGYQARHNKDGTTAHYWSPQRAVKGAADALSTIRLPDDLSEDEVAEECRRRTEELRAEMRGLKGKPHFDGTISSLIKAFKADTTSNLHSVKHSTRIRDYEPSLRVLDKDVGARRIDKLAASDFKRWYGEWKKKGHRRAAGAIKLLRLIISYGAGEKLHGCAVARLILSDIQFDQPAPRTVAMTYDQCLAIVKKSAELK